MKNRNYCAVHLLIAFWFTLLCGIDLCAAVIQDKVLICGICKNVERAVPNTIASIDALGSKFIDYQVVIYENNSTDKTKELFQEWEKQDPHVIFLSEDLTKKELAQQVTMKVANRTEVLARARNIVLDVVMKKQYDDFKYVIWADLDFLDLWDVANVVDTILHPEQEWDAVFANGLYDLFALRDAEFPIGFELLGKCYWGLLDQIRTRLIANPPIQWRKVYSAFGGLGIYKRESLKGCHYSGVVTKELERLVATWLEQIGENNGVCLFTEYRHLLGSVPVITLKQEVVQKRKHHPDELGVRLHNQHGDGKVTWFSCTKKRTLPWTCEHIPLHAQMIVRGHDKLYINPRIKSNHP